MNNMTITPHLENVQRTLLLPLWARAHASRMARPVLVDKKAMELVGQIDFNFEALTKNFGTFHAISMAARAKAFDTILLDFLRRKGSASVVNVGAGLDTSFSRVQNDRVKWFDVDMPEVIALRKKLIPETAGMREIPKSILDESTLDELGQAENVFIIVGGVLMYFNEEQVRGFFESIARHFQNAEIVFDVISLAGARYYNHKLAKTGFGGAAMEWGVCDVQKLGSLHPKLQIVRCESLFKSLRGRSAWPLAVRAKIRIAGLLNAAEIVHMRVS